jgi:formyltetrahydrofolate-dependent phosphoribosylglycinamide formyltransferase
MIERVRVGILISGRGYNMSALIKASEAADCPYKVVLIVSNRLDAPGLSVAHAHDIPTFARSHKGLERADFDGIIDAALREADVEIVALAGYMRVLSDGFIEGWRGRVLNVHPSLLPLYKGLDTHARALAAGDLEAGCSVHLVTPELDDGPVIGQTRVPILPGDTSETLAQRVLQEEHRLYPRALTDWINAKGGKF